MVDVPSNILTTIPVITDRVLSCLPAVTLNTAARVCRAWANACRRIKHLRKMNPSCFFRNIDETYDLHKALISLKYDYLNRLYAEPKLTIVFATDNIIEGKGACVPNRGDFSNYSSDVASCIRRRKKKFLKCLNEVLPPSSGIFGVGSSGVIGTDGEGKVKEQEGEDAAFSCLCLPAIPDVSVRQFILTQQNFKKWKQQYPWVMQDNDIKCLLLFPDGAQPFHDLNNAAKEICKTIWNRRSGDVVIGGGIAEYVFGDGQLNPEEIESESNILVVGISGKNVKAASIILGSEVTTAETVQQHLRKLKQVGLNEETSFAFQFACLGRGWGWYGEHNVEADAFRKVFPKTPLVGFFGNGEIGHDALEVGNFTEKPFPNIDHAYTTVFCFISIG